MPNNQYRTPNPGPLGFKTFGADFGSAQVSTQYFTLTSEDGTKVYYIYVDASGRLRITAANTIPVADTTGTIVGTQT
jgi:hypothetical protein